MHLLNLGSLPFSLSSIFFVFFIFWFCDSLLRIGQTNFFLRFGFLFVDRLLTVKRFGLCIYFFLCVHRIQMFERKTKGGGGTAAGKSFTCIIYRPRSLGREKERKEWELILHTEFHWIISAHCTHGIQNSKTNLWCIFLRNVI